MWILAIFFLTRQKRNPFKSGMTANFDFNFGVNVSCTGYGNEGVNSGGWDSQDSREGYTHIYL